MTNTQFIVLAIELGIIAFAALIYIIGVMARRVP